MSKEKMRKMVRRMMRDENQIYTLRFGNDEDRRLFFAVAKATDEYIEIGRFYRGVRLYEDEDYSFVDKYKTKVDIDGSYYFCLCPDRANGRFCKHLISLAIREIKRKKEMLEESEDEVKYERFFSL